MSEFLREFWDYYWPRRKFFLGFCAGVIFTSVETIILLLVAT